MAVLVVALSLFVATAVLMAAALPALALAAELLLLVVALLAAALMMAVPLAARFVVVLLTAALPLMLLVHKMLRVTESRVARPKAVTPTHIAGLLSMTGGVRLATGGARPFVMPFC